MAGRRGRAAADDREAREGRRGFLKKALAVAAYVAPAVVSYPSTVFATHMCPGEGQPKMGQENCMGQIFTPGCSPVN